MSPMRALLPVFLAIAAVLGAAVVFWHGPAGAQPGLPGPLEDVTGGGSEDGAEGDAAEAGGVLPDEPPKERFLASELLAPDAWPGLGERLLERFLLWLPSLLAALVVLVAFFVFNRVLAGLLRRLMGRTKADPAAQSITVRLTRYAVLGLGVVMAVSQLGIDVASLLAGVGILGIAVGLAAQDSLSNLVAGITILWDRPFRVGDNVTVSGTFGEVKGIGLRTTRIRTVDQLDAILPNKEIINQEIINHTLNPMMRLAISLGIAYHEDSREARRVLLDAVRGHDLVLEKPESEVVVTALGDSSVNLELRVWLRDPYTERRATVEMVELAKIALDEAGIEIPFPQRTLHLAGGGRLVREVDGSAGEGEDAT